MTLFHQHLWEVSGSVFNPPNNRITRMRSSDDGALQSVLHGFTTFTERCVGDRCDDKHGGCGKTVVTEQAGKVVL